MTRDEIAQAMQDTAGYEWGNEAHFQRFATLVAAAEREAFAAILKDQMIRDGWRQCAKGQSTTQFCALAEDAVKAEREACAQICYGLAFETAGDEAEGMRQCAATIRARSKT